MSMQNDNTPKSVAAIRPDESGEPKRNRRSVESKIAELQSRLGEIADLGGAESLLGWDHATYMPPDGAEDRGRQSALLRRIAHEKSIDPALGNLIDELAPWAETLPADAVEACLIRVAGRDFERA